MTSRLRTHRRALAACTVIALLTATIVFVAAPSVSSPWWPRTENAFAASPGAPSDGVTVPVSDAARGQATAGTPSNDSEPCDAVAGPAHDYCLGALVPQSSSGEITLANSWPLRGAMAALCVVSCSRRGL